MNAYWYWRMGTVSARLASSLEIILNPSTFLSLERIEVVKGPATLLYGSSAIGGVVNAISEHDAAHPGLRGYVTAFGSSGLSSVPNIANIERRRSLLPV